MKINYWLLSSTLLFITIETAGALYWHYSTLSVVAIYTLVFTIIFFGMFFLSYIGCAFYAEVNSWVSEVDRMDWGFNPMYGTWLFATDRRRWARYVTIIFALFSPFIGVLFIFAVTRGGIDLNSSLIGFSVGSGFLTFLAFSWYEGFWKPRTKEIETEEFYEETESEKPYFPMKPA